MQSVFATTEIDGMYAFSGEQLRQGLARFAPSASDKPDPVWSEYFQTYGMLDIIENYQWCAGLLPESSFELVAQHFFQQEDVPVKGTVVVVHGYTDHAGIYGHLFRYLLEQGWNIVCFDLPGHGLSSGEGYAIHSFDEYSDILENLLTEYQPYLTGPLVLLGQSTGGAIILDHHRLFADRPSFSHISHRVLLAPLVRPASYWTIRLQYLVLSPFLNRVKRYFSVNSHDEDFLAFIRETDPLQQKWVSVSWVGAMLDWVDKIETADTTDVALTVIQGTEDDTVEWQHNLEVISKLYPNAELHRVKGGRHHLVNESEVWRDQVFDLVSQSIKTPNE